MPDPDPAAVAADGSDHALPIVLSDARELSATLFWFPCQPGATSPLRRNWKMTGRGDGLHWPEVDEDISAPILLTRLS